MSRKNRAFALAVATAALVGVSAPVAHAAGPNNTSGFNNDSRVDVSGNPVPVQAGNNAIPVNAGLGVVQVPVDGVSGALGLLNTGSVSSMVSRDCTQTPTQTNSSSTTTGNTVTNG